MTAPLISVEGIGDINSSAKGTGARFNGGKPPMELIPLRIIALSYAREVYDGPPAAALDMLGRFQETGDAKFLHCAIQSLGLEGWIECADVFDYGRRKYAAWNWLRGMPWSVPLACAARHLVAMIKGELDDPESGEPHRGHVFCNITMLLQYQSNFPEGNDLPAPEMFQP